MAEPYFVTPDANGIYDTSKLGYDPCLNDMVSAAQFVDATNLKAFDAFCRGFYTFFMDRDKRWCMAPIPMPHVPHTISWKFSLNDTVFEALLTRRKMTEPGMPFDDEGYRLLIYEDRGKNAHPDDPKLLVMYLDDRVLMSITNELLILMGSEFDESTASLIQNSNRLFHLFAIAQGFLMAGSHADELQDENKWYNLGIYTGDADGTKGVMSEFDLLVYDALAEGSGREGETFESLRQYDRVDLQAYTAKYYSGNFNHNDVILLQIFEMLVEHSERSMFEPHLSSAIETALRNQQDGAVARQSEQDENLKANAAETANSRAAKESREALSPTAEHAESKIGRPVEVAPKGEARKKISIYIGESDFELLKEFAEADGHKTNTAAARHLLLRCLHHSTKPK